VEVAVEDLDVSAEEAVTADADPGPLALDHQVVVELGAIANLDQGIAGARLDMAVTRVEERRIGPAELDPLAQ
jgi:hypothetical protein